MQPPGVFVGSFHIFWCRFHGTMNGQLLRGPLKLKGGSLQTHCSVWSSLDSGGRDTANTENKHRQASLPVATLRTAALSSSPPRRFIQALSTDDYWEVRRDAAEALGGIGTRADLPKEAVDALTKVAIAAIMI